eukprot:scaffold33844_cov101-Isochrysis_galbana.AAC.2
MRGGRAEARTSHENERVGLRVHTRYEVRVTGKEFPLPPFAGGWFQSCVHYNGFAISLTKGGLLLTMKVLEA